LLGFSILREWNQVNVLVAVVLFWAAIFDVFLVECHGEMVRPFGIVAEVID
jgi:hypothetical protein